MAWWLVDSLLIWMAFTCVCILATGSRCLIRYQHFKAKGRVTVFNPPIASSLRSAGMRSKAPRGVMWPPKASESEMTHRGAKFRLMGLPLISSTMPICCTCMGYILVQTPYLQNVRSLKIASGSGYKCTYGHIIGYTMRVIQNLTLATYVQKR